MRLPESRTLPNDPRAVAAIHEAGHAVVSVVLRTGVRRVDINPGADGREGLTSYRPYNEHRWQGTRDAIKRRGATKLGGMAAVWLASGRQRKHRHSGGDMFGGLTYVYEIVGMDPTKREVQACWDAFYDRAVTILETRWSAVEAVTAALVADSVIDRKRLLALMDAT